MTIALHRPSRFTLRRFLLGFVAIGVVFAIWASLLRTAVTIRTPLPTDPVYQDKYGIGILVQPGTSIRSICVAEGVFTQSTKLTGALYVVEAGSIRELNQWTVGRSLSSLPNLPWASLEITVALGDRVDSQGVISQLGATGGESGAGSIGLSVHHVARDFSKTFTGTMRPGSDYLLHVEGDTPPNAVFDLSVQAFAKANSGNYLVVTGRVD